MPYKPENYPDASAYLIVDDAQAVLAFLEAAAGATRERVIATDAGSIMHAEARIGDSIIMMGEAAGAGGGHVHVYVPDVDATFAAAVAAGGAAVQQPVRKEDSDRRCGVTGPSDVTWWFATQQS